MEPIKHHLANLTIMAENDNLAAGNQPFSKKKSEYAKSSVGLTCDLASLSAWTDSEFGGRETALIKMASKVFSFD